MDGCRDVRGDDELGKEGKKKKWGADGKGRYKGLVAINQTGAGLGREK